MRLVAAFVVLAGLVGSVTSGVVPSPRVDGGAVVEAAGFVPGAGLLAGVAPVVPGSLEAAAAAPIGCKISNPSRVYGGWCADAYYSGGRWSLAWQDRIPDGSSSRRPAGWCRIGTSSWHFLGTTGNGSVRAALCPSGTTAAYVQYRGTFYIVP